MNKELYKEITPIRENQMSYRLNSLKRGSTGENIGEYSRV